MVTSLATGFTHSSTHDMKNTLVVVTDLGGFKAFRLHDGEMHSTPRLELLEQFNNAEAQRRLVEKVSDLSGRFPRTTGAAGSGGAMSDGERHNIELEQRKRSVRQIAKQLDPLMRDANFERCFLAASREMNRNLLDELTPAARQKIQKNVPADLMKVDKSALLQRFVT